MFSILISHSVARKSLLIWQDNNPLETEKLSKLFNIQSKVLTAKLKLKVTCEDYQHVGVAFNAVSSLLPCEDCMVYTGEEVHHGTEFCSQNTDELKTVCWVAEIQFGDDSKDSWLELLATANRT